MRKKEKLSLPRGKPKVAIALGAGLLLLVAGVGTVGASSTTRQRIEQIAGQVLGQLLHQDIQNEVAVGDDGVLGGMGTPNDRGTGNRTDVVTLKDSDSDLAWEEFTEIVPTVAATSSLNWLQKYDGIVLVQAFFLPLASATSTQDGRASTTLFVAAGTSTVAQAPDYNADLTTNLTVPQGLIPVSGIATGTLLRNVALSSDILNNQAFSPGGIRASSTWVRIPQGQYVTLFRTTGGSNAIHGSSATSTAGTGIDWTNSIFSIRIRRMTTSTP